MNEIPTAEELEETEFKPGTLEDFALFLVVRMSMMIGVIPLVVWDIMLKQYNVYGSDEYADSKPTLSWSNEILEPKIEPEDTKE